VNQIPVVSPKHPVSKKFVPKQSKPHGLTAETQAALNKLVAAAKKDGINIKVRSGYRSYAEQAAILKRKIVEYGNEELARRYNAEAGKSEHQTGLAVDLWDGKVWGTGISDTKLGKWLWQHSREYGFILRYPPGKEKITGYAYEPWHFRYIGVEDSLNFKPNSTQTLEEYLQLA
ncbi:MAG: M15 family metallopeptidase, partial [Propionibacteriaceae bacterium]|nr:M15 family metallopeptidase [Propionibacteriaceae bacterium]